MPEMATGHALEGAAKVPLSTKFFYGVGSISEGTKNTAFNVFLLFYYNQVLGLSGTLAGFAIFLALCVDAITDPLVGSISDNWHSRWGRRHPFMYAAALPMAVSFWLLFNPPDGLSQTGLFTWFMLFAVAVRASMTLYAIPSASMLPEITSHYDERTSIVSFRFLFGWAGGLTASLLGYLYFFAPTEEFANGQLNPDAYTGFATMCALIVFAAILVCSLGTHKLIPTLRSNDERIPFSPNRFFGEVRDVIANRSYLMLVIGALFASVAGGFSEVVGLYMNTYFWEFSTQQIAVLILGLSVSILVAFAGARPLTERFDKKPAVMGLAIFSVCFGPLPVFLRLLGWFPENDSPLLMPIIMAHGIVVVTAIVVITITIASMIADTIDEIELRTGRRREGMAMSAIAFTSKATSGIGGFVAGVALDIIAFPRGVDPGAVPADKIFLLGLAVGPGLMIFYIFMLFFFARYRITRDAHEETLAELERRRLAASPAIDRVAS